MLSAEILKYSSLILSNVLLKFIDRDDELRALEERYSSGRPEFFIIYGRRRVGKTELIKRFASGKDHFYFLAKEQPIELEIERFREKFAEKFDMHIERNGEWEKIFKTILDKINQKSKFIFIIDEFPFWISKHRPILSEFQYLWDELLGNKNVFLILSGSSVSMMENEVLAYKSPLYGRRTGQLKIEPMKLGCLQEFLPGYSVEDLFRVYGAVGGVPFYLKEFNDGLTVSENIKNTFFNKSSLLYVEAEILLREELREVTTYFNIMKAIIDGATKLAEISSKSRVDITNINKYLSTLINLGLVRKEYPVTQPPKFKNFLYVLNDNYFRFWLRYVYPYQEEIEEDVATVLKIFEDDYSRYMGLIFEDICKKSIRDFRIPIFNFPGTKTGTWWHKEQEIDIIALNDTTKEVLFCECKWQSEVNAKKIFAELKEKAKSVQWNNGSRKEYYAIFAKSFMGITEEPDLMLFDLNDFEKAMKPRNS
ncbi:ATPase domain predominantly from Archaea [uncultured archaeon]|nr:ATPase domain predominantly from Archaea [uncultured archaeon]